MDKLLRKGNGKPFPRHCFDKKCGGKLVTTKKGYSPVRCEKCGRRVAVLQYMDNERLKSPDHSQPPEVGLSLIIQIDRFIRDGKGSDLYMHGLKRRVKH